MYALALPVLFKDLKHDVDVGDRASLYKADKGNGATGTGVDGLAPSSANMSLLSKQ